MGALRVGHRDAEEDQARGRQREAPPLAAADGEAEHAVGHDGDEDDAAREDDLDDRERARSEIAATCSAQPPPPTTMPMANHFDVHSDFALRSGWRISTFAQAHAAPRCLKKNPRFENTAQRNASRMPIWSVMKRGVKALVGSELRCRR